MSPERLVYMVNQIARFFARQPEDMAAVAIADHLRKFWEPRMRRAIIARLDAGDAALSPLTAQAVALLRAPTACAHSPMTVLSANPNPNPNLNPNH